MKITHLDLGWAAGFLEGEGSFSFHNTGVRVTAVQIQREPLERLWKLFGGSICLKPRYAFESYHQWSVAGYAAAGLMMTMFPMMSPKRQAQIMEALRRWKLRPPDFAFRTHCKRGHPYDVRNTYITKSGGRKCRACQPIYDGRCNARPQWTRANRDLDVAWA